MTRRRIAGLTFALSSFGIFFLNCRLGCHAGDLCFACEFAFRADGIFRFTRRSAAHLAHVSIRFREAGKVKRTLDMPVWNALYQVRNFAANVMKCAGTGFIGYALAEVGNTKTSEWEITAPAGCVVVSYDIHLDAPGPFGSSLECRTRLLNWAMVLMYSPALRTQPASLRLLDVPATWALRDVHVLGGAEPGKVSQVVGVANNYDELVDSPAEVGTFRQSAFQEDVRHLPRCGRW